MEHLQGTSAPNGPAASFIGGSRVLLAFGSVLVQASRLPLPLSSSCRKVCRRLDVPGSLGTTLVMPRSQPFWRSGNVSMREIPGQRRLHRDLNLDRVVYRFEGSGGGGC